MEPEIKKIVVIGPESTGKSTLCAQLASFYQTLWCPEFAREYLLKRGGSYDFNDLLNIAKGQVKLEDSIAADCTGKLFFIDTDLYVIKVWGEFVFEDSHRWVLDQIALRTYDLYLFCSTDLPWQPDTLREYPDLASRQKLYHIYQDILINQSVPWVEISGREEERLQMAITAVNSLIHKK